MPGFRSPQVVLFVADVEAATAFYALLGFVERFRTPKEGTPMHVDVELDGSVLGLASLHARHGRTPRDPADHGRRAALVLWCDDVDAALEQLAARGARVLRSPEAWLGRLRVAGIADPDGHQVQLIQRTSLAT
jgi:catechol 2,3-dioxygenase-like lactoylglutathione lyase family enzyme